MKIKIKNFTNKKRSIKQKNELKRFAAFITNELGIVDKVDLISLEFRKEFNGYYPKGKPLGGFNFLYNHGKVRITFARFWDENIKSRKKAIVHELTHARQLISKNLVVIKDKEALWNGKKYDKWKKFRFTAYDSKKSIKDKRKYLISYFPWEEEVQNNVKRYVKTNDLI